MAGGKSLEVTGGMIAGGKLAAGDRLLVVGDKLARAKEASRALRRRGIGASVEGYEWEYICISNLNSGVGS